MSNTISKSVIGEEVREKDTCAANNSFEEGSLGMLHAPILYDYAITRSLHHLPLRAELILRAKEGNAR